MLDAALWSDPVVFWALPFGEHPVVCWPRSRGVNPGCVLAACPVEKARLYAGRCPVE